MRELNNMKIIGVDHGYGNIKTANTVTPTGITVSQMEPIFSGNILEYDGMYYRIGESHKEFVADKVIDDDYYILTLMAVARELNLQGIQQEDIHLAAGLPLTWIRRQRETFRAYLMRNEQVAFRFNGKEHNLHFIGSSLNPQGYPAIVAHLDEFKGINLLADIGNGTMNLLYINNKKPIENRCWTEKMGVNQCMIAAKNTMLDNFGAKVEDATIEQVLRTGTADIGKPYLECITGVVRKYVVDIFATLRRYEYNPDLMRLHIVGGGGCLVKHFGEYDVDRITILDDICATAKGYEYLAHTRLRKEASR